MKKKESFNQTPLPQVDPIATMHARPGRLPEPAVEPTPVETRIVYQAPPAPDRKNETFHLDKRLAGLVGLGKLKEEFNYKNDFVEHILYEYFKDKAYAAEILKGYPGR